MKISFSSDGKGFKRSDMKTTGKLAEDFFGTQKDSEQIQVNQENMDWIFKNTKDCLNVVRDGEEIIGFSLIIPSNHKILDDFVSNKINEREMFERTKNLNIYRDVDALYLASAFIKEKYRGKGFSQQAQTKVIQKVSRMIGKKPVLYFWGYSEKGKKSCLAVAKTLGLNIKERLVN